MSSKWSVFFDLLDVSVEKHDVRHILGICSNTQKGSSSNITNADKSNFARNDINLSKYKLLTLIITLIS